MQGELKDYKGVTTEQELQDLKDHVSRNNLDTGKITDMGLVNWKRSRGMQSSAMMANHKKASLFVKVARKALSPATGNWLVMIRVKPECAEANLLTEADITAWVKEQFYGCDLGSVEIVKLEKE
jgi:hypothetical protein